MRSRLLLAALATTIGLVMGCVGAASPGPSATPAPSPSGAVATATGAGIASPSLTSAPTGAALSWGAILGDQRAYGPFAVEVNVEYDANVLVTKENGGTVGLVYLDMEPAADFTFDVGDPSGLERVASDFAENLRVELMSTDPGGTYTLMPATEVAFGASRGFRSGLAWKDHFGILERWVQYFAAVPGGIEVVSASALPASVPGRGTFNDDATLVRFLPVLDEVVAGLHWPPT